MHARIPEYSSTKADPRQTKQEQARPSHLDSTSSRRAVIDRNVEGGVRLQVLLLCWGTFYHEKPVSAGP